MITIYMFMILSLGHKKLVYINLHIPKTHDVTDWNINLIIKFMGSCAHFILIFK